MKHKLKLLILIMSIGIIGLTCKKPEPETVGNVSGIIKNATNQPIAGALVKINSSPEQSVTTTNDGTYKFSTLPPKDYQIVVSKDGFVTSTQNVTIVAGDTKTLDFPLTAFVPNLSLSQNTFNAQTATGSGTVNVTSNISWNASSNQTWLTCSPTSGTNNGTITINWTENTTTSQRQGTIIVSANGLTSQTITITQAGVGANLQITPTSKTFAATGESLTINVTSNISWNVAADNWITLNQASGTNNGIITATCGANPNTTQRTGTITFSGSGVSNQTISVTQTGQGITFTVNPATLNFIANGETKPISITSNTSWTVSSDQTSWCTVSASSGSNNGQINVICNANPNTSQRTATVTFTYGTSNQIVSITQAGIAISLTVSPTTMTFDQNGNITNPAISITSNTSWTASSNQSWCTLSATSGTNNGNLNVICQSNTGTTSRIATITFTGLTPNPTVTVTQSGSAAYITVNLQPTGLNYMMSSTLTINWSKNVADAVNIDLYKGGTLLTSGLSTNNFSTSYQWTIPLNLALGNDYKIRVTSATTGTLFGESSVFTISLYQGTISDNDGNTYNTVQIGQQIWMKENLKTTKYRNGDLISNITDNTQWSQQTGGAYCDYDNTLSNANIYGRLYNWYAINDSRYICPSGWHIPSNQDWTSLINYCGGLSSVGGELKSTSGWYNSGNGSDNYGFSALAGGIRNQTNGAFVAKTQYAYIWRNEQYSTTDAAYLYLEYSSTNGSIYNDNKRNGLSVRCIKD